MINFGDIPEEYALFEKAAIALLPVPYDGTSTWVKGADKAPQAILEASANMELFDIDTGFEVYKKGIYTDKPIQEHSSAESMAKAVEKRTDYLLEHNKFVVTIGGEHSVSIGAMRAHAKKIKNLSILQLDAHADLRESYEGTSYSHASVMARARELCPIVQAGIRSISAEESIRDPENVFWAKDIHHHDGWIPKLVDKLNEQVYITIDLDVFDPAVLPATGTPEPGGLFWYQILKLLHAVNKERKIAGFDVVELCPNPFSKASDFLAARLIYQLLSLRFNPEK